MQESPTYQSIVHEGLLKGKRETLLMLGERRFGAPSVVALQPVESIQDPAVLDALLLRLLEVESWDETLAG